MTAARRAETRPSRFRGWRNGWGMALRMARREIRRDRVRTGFIWLMIALPVATICAIHIVLATSDLSNAERLELRLGGTQASLGFVGYGFQPGYDRWGSTGDGYTEGDATWPATPLPGWGESVTEQEQAVAQLAGQPALAVTVSDLTVPSGLSVIRLGIDTGRPEAAGVVRLQEGRLPAAPSEVLVTPAGLARGLPSAGSVRLLDESDAAIDAVVVGVAQATFDGVADLVAAPDEHPAAVRTFLVAGDHPVTWEDAVRFADHGFVTSSRHLLDHPPAGTVEPTTEELTRFVLQSLFGAAALLEVALITGPAFAIGAARQRRSLALAAANGAPATQLRRAALGQSILLGVSAAVVGALLGTAAGIGLWPLLSSNPLDLHGPLEVPVAQLVMVLGLGVVATIAAALVASRGLGGLDLTTALRGGLRSGRPRPGAPIVGGALAVVGMALVWSVGTVLEANEVWVFVVWLVGAVAVLVGALLLVPALTRAIGGLAGSTPISIRMALRETSRQQGRATSTVASIMAGGIVLGVMWTIVTTTQVDSERGYRAAAPHGQAMVSHRDDDRPGSEFAGAKSIIAAVDPELQLARTGLVLGAAPDDAEADPLQLAAINPGCDPGEVLFLHTQPPVECEALNGNWGGPRQGILTGSVEDLTILFGLDDQQQGALRDGLLLLDVSPAPQRDTSFRYATTQVVGGEVTMARGDWADEVITTQQVAVHPITTAVIERGAALDRVGALISLDAAQQRQWVPGVWELRVVSPDGPVTPELEATLRQALEPAGFVIEVERGWRPRDEPLVWGITGTLGLLAVVAASMATVLGVAELRPFLGTLAAVGADPRLSRRLASVQAWVLGLLGTALGAGIGLAVGAPIAMAPTTHDSTVAPVLGLPWPVVAALVLIVPLVAALVAAICVPAKPVLVRRTA